jgi:DNA-binding NarL/FixJ family response regulator
MVLVFSAYDEALYASRVLRIGARGYVAKHQLDETVLVAIRRVLDGEIYLSNQLQSRFAKQFVCGRSLETETPLNALSDRQLQVFRLIGQGHSTRKIAGSLNLSIKTVESHRENIKNKLNLESSTELVHHATQWGEMDRV